MTTKTHKNLYQLLCEQKDPRRRQGTRHQLPFIMMIVIMAVMSGSLSIVAIADFAVRHKKALYACFKLQGKKQRIPSVRTIGRLLASLHFKQLSSLFHQWAKQHVKIDKKDWIALDGKVIAGTVSNAHNQLQNFTSLVSVFSHKRKKILALDKFDHKQESEITIVKKLIKLLDLDGVIFTLDALHCQKETIKTIIETGNNYLISVKNNQRNLLTALKKTSIKATCPGTVASQNKKEDA